MAKKKVEQDSTLTPSPSPSGRGEQAELGYTVGLWAWKEQYRCKQCDFDTLDLGVMEEHLMMAHENFKFQEPATPASTPPLNTTAPLSANDNERADGIFEIDLKEDQ